MAEQRHNQPDWRQTQYDRWTRDVTALMSLVTGLAALVITAGTAAGFFHYPKTLPVYILLVVILPVWWVARNGGWKWARYFPVVLCFGFGVYSTFITGVQSLFVLAYALAVLIAGMLFGDWLSHLIMIASILAYSITGILVSGFSFGVLADIVTFSFSLVGVALLQGYTMSHLQRALKSQIESNESLKQEVELRRTAEQVQRDQESQIRRLAENTTDMVAEIDVDGRLLYVSPSYRMVLGYDPAALVGTNAFDLVHPDEREEAQRRAQRSMESHAPAQMQMQARRQDGEYIFVDVASSPLYDEQGRFTGFVISSRDITQQKKAEAALLESEQKYRQIIESLPLGVHIYSLEEDGRLILSGFNSMANRITHADHTSVLGRTIEEAFSNLVMTEIPERYHEIARSGGRWDSERVDYQGLEGSGSYEVHAFQSSPSQVVVVFSDITGRIQAEEALRLSEQKFSTVFMTSPDSINLNRLSDGLFLEINQGFTRLTGYTREDTIGKSSLKLNIWVDPADREKLVQGLREYGVVDNLEARFRRKNGKIDIGLMSARVMEIEGELCILSITRDITARIEAEILLRENEAQLREAHHRLSDAYEATLRGWARALELRERETANHSQRVVEHAVRTGRILGISGETLLHLQRGALLHDIGKLGVPDQVLLKPGPLSGEEWVIMRQHPVFARDMLIDIDYLRDCIDIPYNHHERWDGTGYPRGLKGEEIPLAARVFAIVDVYDALTHNRPYRPAWPHEDAVHYLLEQSGKHFDPRILDVFLSEMDIIIHNP